MTLVSVQRYHDVTRTDEIVNDGIIDTEIL